jgi:5-methylcytosine-specific restriction protein A
MKKKICFHAGCNELIDYTERYCPKHKGEAENNRNNRPYYQNAMKYNTSLYNTVRWRKLRAEHLRGNPYCICCGTREKPLQVDHIVTPKGNEDLFYDANNLQTLCLRCHAVKTNREVWKKKY